MHTKSQNMFYFNLFFYIKVWTYIGIFSYYPAVYSTFVRTLNESTNIQCIFSSNPAVYRTFLCILHQSMNIHCIFSPNPAVSATFLSTLHKSLNIHCIFSSNTAVYGTFQAPYIKIWIYIVYLAPIQQSLLYFKNLTSKYEHALYIIQVLVVCTLQIMF